MFLLLAKYRLKALLLAFRGSKQIGKLLLLAVALGVFLFSMTTFAYGIYEYAKMYPDPGINLLNNLVAVFFHGMFVLLCFSGLSLAMLTVFFSKELELLLSLPIKPSTVFFYKVVESIFANGRLSLVFLVPFLIIYGIYFNAGAAFYILMIPIIFAMAAIPSSIGLWLAAILSRRIPKSRQKSILTVVGALIGLSVWIVMLQFSGNFSENSADFGSPTMKMSRIAHIPLLKYLPSGWAYTASISAARGDWRTSLPLLMLLVFGAIVFSYLALVSTKKYYANGVTEEIGGTKVRATLSMELGGSPIWAHVKRDILLLMREPSVLIQSFLMLMFCLLFPILSHKGSSGLISKFPFSVFAAFFATFFGGQFGSRLVPLERLGFWLNLVTPEGRWLTLGSKAIVGILTVILFVGAVGAAHFAFGVTDNMVSILYLIAFGITGFASGIFFGTFFGDFKWELPQRMIRTGWLLIFIFSIMVFSGVQIGLVYVARNLLSQFINPVIVSLFFSLGFLAISIIFSALRIMNMEWRPEV